VYLDLYNSLGQSVYVNIATCQFAPSQTSQCFIPVSTSVTAGTYSAIAFVTTDSNVPVSAQGSAQLSF